MWGQPPSAARRAKPCSGQAENKSVELRLTDSGGRLSPHIPHTSSSHFELGGSFCRVPQALHFVMRSQNTGSLTADNLSNILWQIGCDRLLISIFGNVLAVLEPVENCLISAAQANFRVHPCAMQRSYHRAGNFLVRLSQPDEFRFQFTGETRTLQALLVKERLQVASLDVGGGLQVSLLPVFAGFN